MCLRLVPAVAGAELGAEGEGEEVLVARPLRVQAEAPRLEDAVARAAVKVFPGVVRCVHVICPPFCKRFALPC